MIGVIQIADLMAHLHHAHVRIKIAQKIVSFLHHRTEFVAHTEVECEILKRPPVILEKPGIGPVVQLQGWVSYLDR